MNPLDEYSRRLGQRRGWVERCRLLDRRVANARLVIALLFVAALWMAFGAGSLPRWAPLVPVAAFAGLAAYHDRVYREGRRALRAVAFYERGIARIEDRWTGEGNAAAHFAGESHLYAADLDLFGKGSLFELLCTARTRAGEETLARWILEPAAPDEIALRHDAINELRDNVDLREDLTVLGPEVRETVHPEAVIRWATAPLRLDSRAARIAAPALAAATLTAVVYSWVFGGSGWWLLAAAAAQIAFGAHHLNRVREVTAAVSRPAGESGVLYTVLARIERERFSSPKLRQLRSRLDRTGDVPSRQIARLARYSDLLDSRLNQMFTPIAYLLLWSTQLAYAIESWRGRCGPALEEWLDTIGEIEALCALAGYAFEHPQDPFPEIVEEETLFEGENMRHPLLPQERSVPNSVRLGGERRMLIVSGSNMSGKSTLLRTVGINAVLAQAGAPVRAHRLRLGRLAIGATLRVQDSLQSGTSRFYAEIQRLHEIMELTRGALPVLFLLDEILHGTNSHDRAIGSEAVIRGLLERRAIGLVTTHDLALTRVAETLAPATVNVHFQDHMENGRMVFDYLLHPGVVQKSNALELMRAVGLQV